jgi:hypothetical protein
MTARTTQNFRNGWYAPFFYEDSRHVFYVTTSVTSVQLSQWNRYGVLSALAPPRRAIPKIVTEMKISGRASLKRAISEQGQINTAIAGGGTVRYGDKEIGLAGVRSNRKTQPA